ncbi:hypothetical protein [Nocardiopsis suaedae]|uniref:Uncharacterized protein n=1 Tax=Nocardiopsis suaedae TaxID=3018444 RepID=A0ABT4TWP1_9ACTN|nr:hypothetical protein [Nocardiopsis suaedae]MDA2808654.1 hypothetical protein [Nocardiopsis suaedae]
MTGTVGAYDLTVGRVVSLEGVRWLCSALLGVPVWLGEELADGRALPADYGCLDYAVEPRISSTWFSCGSTRAPLAEWEFASRAARAFAARCWVADDTVVPSRMLLAEPDGTVLPVHAEDIDDDGLAVWGFRLDRACGRDDEWCRASIDCRGSAFPPDWRSTPDT